MNRQTAPKKPRSIRRPYADDDAKWRAVQERDRAADGVFFYSVRTTGVYCRPSCGSKRARRENVAFHPSADAAERAGFRPCKRCSPHGPALEQEHAAAVAKACRAIEQAEEPMPLRGLAAIAGMSTFHFHRTFRRITGTTPKEYARAHRAGRVRRHLPQSATVTEAIYGAGFRSNGRFYADSTQTLGMTPTAYRSRGAGETIRFAIGECSLGSVLVAASARGVCAISLGEDPDALLRELQDRFANAELIGADRGFEQTVARVIGGIEQPQLGLDLPLDIRGTLFQQRVWRALQAIPLGETRTYTELARDLGVPDAVRAVASACASNTIAVAIPCHRVIRRDGSLAGYRWGIERKRALLQRERAS